MAQAFRLNRFIVSMVTFLASIDLIYTSNLAGTIRNSCTISIHQSQAHICITVLARASDSGVYKSHAIL